MFMALTWTLDEKVSFIFEDTWRVDLLSSIGVQTSAKTMRAALVSLMWGFSAEVMNANFI